MTRDKPLNEDQEMAKTPVPLTDEQKAAAAAARATAKADKFAKLAPKRIDNALKAIRLIGNLSSKSGYSYTAEQVAKMTTALDTATKETLARFAPDAAEAPKSGFTF